MAAQAGELERNDELSALLQVGLRGVAAASAAAGLVAGVLLGAWLGRIEEIFTNALGGDATKADLQECRELVVALKLASLCGHGTGLARFAESILRYYLTEIEPCFK